jgi:hypothetical protein
VNNNPVTAVDPSGFRDYLPYGGDLARPKEHGNGLQYGDSGRSIQRGGFGEGSVGGIVGFDMNDPLDLGSYSGSGPATGVFSTGSFASGGYAGWSGSVINSGSQGGKTGSAGGSDTAAQSQTCSGCGTAYDANNLSAGVTVTTQGSASVQGTYSSYDDASSIGTTADGTIVNYRNVKNPGGNTSLLTVSLAPGPNSLTYSVTNIDHSLMGQAIQLTTGDPIALSMQLNAQTAGGNASINMSNTYSLSTGETYFASVPGSFVGPGSVVMTVVNSGSYTVAVTLTSTGRLVPSN